MWNGEVFEGLSATNCLKNDTAFVSKLFLTEIENIRADDHTESSSVTSAIIRALCKIRGPYAFIYYHKLSSTVVFGRDPFGRRSLLIHRDIHQSIACVSSVIPDEWDTDISGAWEEIKPDGVYFLPRLPGDLPNNEIPMTPWPEHITRLGRSPPFPMESSFAMDRDAAAHGFLCHLCGAVARRVARLRPSYPSPLEVQLDPTETAVSSCRVGVLFSGGIDSVLLAACLHLALPILDPIDLLNVTFLGCDTSPQLVGSCHADSPSSTGESSIPRSSCPPPVPPTVSRQLVPVRSPDRLAAIAAVAELKVSL